jgi:Ca-activated chloride channel family protein
MNFGAPEWFWALLLIPLLAFLFLRAEQRRDRRLREFVSPRLLPKLAGTVNRFRRALKFLLLLLALGLAITALAKPRWGYVYDEVKRKGLDLIFAVDTSRSMLSNDVSPDRLQRVKLAAQDLINELQGDRVGLIAFAGRAFLQAPLTIDYDAVVDAINDLDTKTIPEGGTNISDAINLAGQTFGKSAIGNRALIIFTDGEELSGDAVKTAKVAAETGVRIFTVGVGTSQGSLIPIAGEDGGTSFVKDGKGQVVKSKLDEKRLREIAQETGGIYLHLENGPSTMKQLLAEGLSKMQAGDIDARTSRRPIERYHWPLSAALLALVSSLFISERRRVRSRTLAAERSPSPQRTLATAALILLSISAAYGSAPGLDAYRDEKFNEAYDQFQKTLKDHPASRATDKIEFDSGAAAYKMKDYGKAMQAFSQALLSPDTSLQSKSHYNLGNTLYEQGDTQKSDEKKLTDWNNALQHYEQTLKIDPQNKEAKENAEFVKKKIEELKKKKRAQQPTPTPSPSPNQQSSQKQKDQQQQQDQKQQQQQSSQQNQDQQNQEQRQQQQDQSGKGENQKSEKNPEQSQAKNNSQKPNQDKDRQQNPGESPSPSPGNKPDSNQPSSSPGNGEDQPPQESPTPSENGSEKPSPSPGDGQGEGHNAPPTATPGNSPEKKLSGEVKGAPGEKPDKPLQAAEAESNKEGKMSEQQAERLLQSMKDEEARVQLDERKAARHVYNDW